MLGQALREKNRHWDFLLKEMMWMADDFQQERKRHMVRMRAVFLESLRLVNV